MPLAAIAILSSLFLFSKSRDAGDGVHLYDGDLTEFASKERITSPRFAGMTPSGIAIQVSATEASPLKTGGPSFDATDVVAVVNMPDGEKIDVIAKKGLIDALNNNAELTGGIILKTTDGYIAETFGMTFALSRLNIKSQGEITATSPFGMIKAGSMSIKSVTLPSGDTATGYDLMFSNGIKLVYKP